MRSVTRQHMKEKRSLFAAHDSPDHDSLTVLVLDRAYDIAVLIAPPGWGVTKVSCTAEKCIESPRLLFLDAFLEISLAADHSSTPIQWTWARATGGWCGGCLISGCQKTTWVKGVEAEQPQYKWNGPHTSQWRAFLEIKPTIPSLGELLRQVNLYRASVPGVEAVVVTPATEFDDALNSQGILVVHPELDQLRLVAGESCELPF